MPGDGHDKLRTTLVVEILHRHQIEVYEPNSINIIQSVVKMFIRIGLFKVISLCKVVIKRMTTGV